MSIIMLRRRKLGRTSCREITHYMTHDVTVVRNDLAHRKMPANVDQVIRWGCTDNSPTNHVINTTAAIHQVNNKTAFRAQLDTAGLCPKTWFTRVDTVETPCIVRPNHHAQGRNLYLCNNAEEVYQATARCGPGYYISELINKVAEYRVFVMSGKVVWVAQKTPGNPQDIAWNVARGGRFDNVAWKNWPKAVCQVAISAFNLTELDFGGVDVMVDGEGKATVLEINSAPSQTSPYRQQCVAKALDYLIDHGKDRIELDNSRKGYGRYIHPAIDGR